MTRIRNIAIALAVLAFVGVAVLITGNRPEKPPLTIKYFGVGKNAAGTNVAIFVVKNVSKRVWDVGVSLDRFKSNEWSNVTDQWSYRPLAPGEKVMLAVQIPPGSKTIRGTAHGWKLNHGTFAWLINKLFPTRIIRVESDEVHIP